MVEQKLNDFEILLVEDNTADIRLTQEAIQKSTITSHLNVVKDGVEAINYLKRIGKYSKVKRPDLIFLDLNLPKKGGLEVLSEIKQDTDLRRIPVVILTISANEEDLIKAYNFHANCFINKPLDIKEFYTIMEFICIYWFKIVKLAR
ncbi:MAG: response regulator [Candidatus Lokiarchaeota archaeon]|nr:response regulator [Candidatus Lokiarchaeota archaeon]